MRGATRGSARARIIRVGSQLEAIAPALLPAVAVGPHLTEYGLPFLIEIPPALALAPAEIVTLTVESK